MHLRNLSSVPKSIARIDYDIPERYRNAFFLANAAFFDSTNWFLHRAYEAVFPILKNSYREHFQSLHVNDSNIHEKLENIVESIDQCNSILDVRFPVKRENGKLEVIRGFRAHYCEAIGNTPCLGGFRIHSSITRDHIKALALLSAMKNFCIGTGLSGAMGGIKVNPKEYSECELKEIVSLYVTELYKKGYCKYSLTNLTKFQIIFGLQGNHTDVVHPDVNTSAKEMSWVQETFSKCSGQSLNAASTGKPLECGGVENYDIAAALGAFKALETFINNGEIMLKTGCIKTGLKNKRFIIQGLGKVGRPLGVMLIENGAICVGVKEEDAYLYDAKGIDLYELYKYKDDHGTIENFGISKTEFPDSIFTEECDILVLAARQKSLVCYIARDVKARVILEASDGPVTPTSHKILTTKSKLVIPDIYASSGAAVISYFEYLRNLQQIGLPTDNVLRFSTNIHQQIFQSMNQAQLKVNGSSQTQYNVFLPLDHNFCTNSIECVYSSVGQEIIKNLEQFKLGIDVRTAAYTVAIQNMFKIIFQQKILI
ncbi:hypothetical protein HUJ05_011880 [Dendroctonus ponderosae]|nr:hypothetical protein HUJ05_011880 [Dendroctonus ponderosae]